MRQPNHTKCERVHTNTEKYVPKYNMLSAFGLPYLYVREINRVLEVK